MGSWGPKLYQNDVSDDVRNYYINQTRRGKDSQDIVKELIQDNYDLLTDMDDAPNFWFALADTLWEYGKLDDNTKQHALYWIENDKSIEKWAKKRKMDMEIRKLTLNNLYNKLISEQPPVKKVKQYKLYKCEWKVGDVYAYKLNGDYAEERGIKGKYIYFIKVDEMVWHPGHIVPVVYVFWTITDELLKIDQLKQDDYIPQFYKPILYLNKPEEKVLYMLNLLNTSRRVIPNKQLVYIGNVENVKKINNENANAYSVSWKDFEKYIINNFENWEEYRNFGVW